MVRHWLQSASNQAAQYRGTLHLYIFLFTRSRAIIWTVTTPSIDGAILSPQQAVSRPGAEECNTRAALFDTGRADSTLYLTLPFFLVCVCVVVGCLISYVIYLQCRFIPRISISVSCQHTESEHRHTSFSEERRQENLLLLYSRSWLLLPLPLLAFISPVV